MSFARQGSLFEWSVVTWCVLVLVRLDSVLKVGEAGLTTGVIGKIVSDDGEGIERGDWRLSTRGLDPELIQSCDSWSACLKFLFFDKIRSPCFSVNGCTFESRKNALNVFILTVYIIVVNTNIIKHNIKYKI